MKAALLLTLCILVAGCTSSPSAAPQTPEPTPDVPLQPVRAFEEVSWDVGKNKLLADWDVRVLRMGQDPRGFRADVNIKNIPATWDTFYFTNTSLVSQLIVQGKAYTDGRLVDNIRFQGFENRTITLIFPITPTTPAVQLKVGSARYPASDNWAEFSFIEELPA